MKTALIKKVFQDMKRRRTALAGMLLIPAVLFAGCGAGDRSGEQSGAEGSADQTVEESIGDTEDFQRDDSGYRVGKVVSDAYTDPELYKVDEEDLKATGFVYDRASLTYELVWSDEFDYEGAPDPEKWGYDVGGSGWGNNELQYYTEGDNVTVTDGMLVIEARKEEMGGRDYTSSRLVTRNKGDWTYCKVEVYAKLPSGLGTWPAIWMLPTDYEYGSWPASGEVDIMEHVGYDQDVIVQSVHNQKYHGAQSRSHSIHTEGVSEEFHLYSVEWLPDKLIFYVDGEEQYIYDPQQITSQPTYEYWPFDKRMHLLINLAFGGDWGGARGVDDSYFPIQYEVDYVRVYQSPEIMELTGQTQNNID
ncbi:MAG: glycoside hydrolase family 16 protein [Acetatifactor sp.]|nr:glycoside hydrolase family 16 protein [Acetatifactor sp.]